MNPTENENEAEKYLFRYETRVIKECFKQEQIQESIFCWRPYSQHQRALLCNKGDGIKWMSIYLVSYMNMNILE